MIILNKNVTLIFNTLNQVCMWDGEKRAIIDVQQYAAAQQLHPIYPSTLSVAGMVVWVMNELESIRKEVVVGLIWGGHY
jgi:hypothetical protein